MTKCLNGTNNRAMSTMGAKTMARENNSERTISPETIGSPYMADNGLQQDNRMSE